MRLFRFFTLVCWSLCVPFYLGGLGLAPTQAHAQAIAIDKVLVVVNEAAITLSEYQARHLREALEKSTDTRPFDGRVDPRILNLMINDRLQAQMAARRGIRVTPADVEKAVAFIARQNDTTPPQLLTQLAADGITPAQFRASLKEQQLIRRLVDTVVNARVTVSEQEINNYLASHRELADSDEAYEVSHLFIALEGKSLSEAQSEQENLAHIRTAVVEGRPFAQSAREFSDSPNREEGGYLGWRKIAQLPKLFVQALRDTEVGAVSEIIRSPNGLHLLKVHDHRAGGKVVEQQLLRHILIRPGPGLREDAVKERADELHARIIAGEDFEAIARAHSADQVSGIDGGRLGWINPGDFPPKFEQALTRLALNELSKPLRSQAGYHLVKVLDRRRTDISVELAGKRARQVIFKRKAAAFYENWYGAIRDAAHIEYVSANPG